MIFAFGVVRSHFYKLGLVILLATFTTVTNAQNALYSVQVPMMDSSSESVKAAKLDALTLLVTRVTGQVSSWQNIRARVSDVNVDYYINRVSVLRNDDDESVLAVEFDEQVIAVLFDATALPVWLGLRPSLGVWMIIRKDTSEQRIVTQESRLPSVAADDAVLDIAWSINTAADRRGLDIQIPASDLANQQGLESYVRTGQLGLLKERASLGTDFLIVATAEQNADASWHLDGWYELPTGIVKFATQGANYREVVESMMETVAGRLAAIYAENSLADTERSVFIDVLGVDSFHDFVQVNEALSKVSRIGSLQLQHITPDSLRFVATYAGEVSQLAFGVDLIERLSLDVDDHLQFIELSHSLEQTPIEPLGSESSLMVDLLAEAQSLGLETQAPEPNFLPNVDQRNITESLTYRWQ